MRLHGQQWFGEDDMCGRGVAWAGDGIAKIGETNVAIESHGDGFGLCVDYVG